MNCYRPHGCGPYEMLPCNECPASKPEYAKREEKKMTVVHQYICDICKTRYAEEGEARLCESGHLLKPEIVSMRHRPLSDDHTGLPQTITVRFKDDHMGRFRDCVYKRG